MQHRTACSLIAPTSGREPTVCGRGALAEQAMYLNVDYARCEGCGGCAEAFPHFFRIRDGKAWVINAGEFILEENPGVLTICPYYAISVE